MAKRVVIYGGRGGLGSVLVNHFKAQSWWVCSVDLAANDTADANVLVDPADDWLKQEAHVCAEVAKVVGSGNKLEAVINMAGGWAGGNAAADEFVKSCDLMWKQSVWSSAISASVASKHLKAGGGCLVLPGAQPATDGTPGMMGYGMAKAAVHQLVKSLAAEKSGLPDGTFTAAILPVTLDTPMNRKWMPKAGTEK